MGRNRKAAALIIQRSVQLTLVFCLLFTALFMGAAEASGTDLIVINKKTNKLAFFSGGKLEKVFPVATGRKKSLTPEGKFKIVNKIKNRPYYKEKIPGGDPANPLGDRWLGLEVNGTMGTTYAIHGNNNESSIGKYVSSGCIRMHNDDIHWLFPKVSKGTVVIITSTELGMEQIALKHGYPLGTNLFAGKLNINGTAVKLNQPFVLDNNRVFIPLRESAVLFGAKLALDQGTGELVITLGTRTVIHKPLADTAAVNGRTVMMIPSRNVNGSLMIPLSSVPALFGLQVKWESQTNTAIISD